MPWDCKTVSQSISRFANIGTYLADRQPSIILPVNLGTTIFHLLGGGAGIWHVIKPVRGNHPGPETYVIRFYVVAVRRLSNSKATLFTIFPALTCDLLCDQDGQTPSGTNCSIPT